MSEKTLPEVFGTEENEIRVGASGNSILIKVGDEIVALPKRVARDVAAAMNKLSRAPRKPRS